MLFNHSTDANSIDTFEIKPQETDVTIHSAVSTYCHNRSALHDETGTWAIDDLPAGKGSKLSELLPYFWANSADDKLMIFYFS